jgi:hypothetical protein
MKPEVASVDLQCLVYDGLYIDSKVKGNRITNVWVCTLV